MEVLDLRNVLEIKSILDKCSENEKIIFNYVLDVANKNINSKGLDKPCPMEVECHIAPELSDHSSDEDEDEIEIEIIENSDSE